MGEEKQSEKEKPVIKYVHPTFPDKIVVSNDKEIAPEPAPDTILKSYKPQNEGKRQAK